MSVHREIHLQTEMCDHLAANGILQERRTALIFATVTGKIDVRGLAVSEAVWNLSGVALAAGVWRSTTDEFTGPAASAVPLTGASQDRMDRGK